MIMDDSVLESDESFKLSIIAVYPVVIGTMNYTIVEIFEDSFDCKLLLMKYNNLLLLLHFVTSSFFNQ